MDDSFGSTASVVSPSKARKRIRQESTWKANIAKQMRYSAKSMPVYPTCKHNTKSYRCCSLRMAQIRDFHKAFYRVKEKLAQDNFIMNHRQNFAVKRRRQKTGDKETRSYSTKYFVQDFEILDSIPVCKKAFVSILGVFTITELSNQVPEISRSALDSIVTDKLGYKTLCARLVPKMLSDDHKARRMASATVFSEPL
ncbi:hypothetical protein J6590_020884 [Homalodisca vitripennis]|nr:hypothetical protein J6590_020884 [Homalodisca vitripennis]